MALPPSSCWRHSGIRGARSIVCRWPTLADANQLDRGDSIAGLQALVVPVPPVAEPSARTRLYVVRRGDTLVTIADRFGVSLEPAAALERNPFRHPGGAGPPPARGRARTGAPRLNLRIVTEPRPPRPRARPAPGIQDACRSVRVRGRTKPLGKTKSERAPATTRPQESPPQNRSGQSGLERQEIRSAVACHSRRGRKNRSKFAISRLCFACLSVQAKATIACASKMFSPALRNSELNCNQR